MLFINGYNTMKKSVISLAVAGAMTESWPIPMNTPMFFGCAGESTPNSAESKHLKNNGEPWKRRNKRGFK